MAHKQLKQLNDAISIENERFEFNNAANTVGQAGSSSKMLQIARKNGLKKQIPKIQSGKKTKIV